MRYRVFNQPQYKTIVRALESEDIRATTVIEVGEELGDVVDITDASKTVEWIGSLIKTVASNSQCRRGLYDNLTIVVRALAGALVGRMISCRDGHSADFYGSGSFSLGLDKHSEDIFQLALAQICIGLEGVERVAGFIESSRERGVIKLFDDDVQRNAERINNIYDAEYVGDSIQSAIRGPYFCPLDTKWLYRSTGKAHAPYSVSLISKKSEGTVANLLPSKEREGLDVVVISSMLEFYIRKHDGELLLPNEPGKDLRGLFAAENASVLYEALRAYHAGGLLMLSSKSREANRFYRQMFVGNTATKKYRAGSEKQTVMIEDGYLESRGLGPGLRPSNGNIVEIEHSVRPHTRNLPSNKRQSYKALEIAEQDFRLGKLSLNEIRLLREDKAITYISEHKRNEGAE